MLILLGAAALLVAGTGRLVGDSWGAKGPCLYHLGIPTGLSLLTLAAVTAWAGRRLGRRGPDRLAGALVLWRALRRAALLVLAAALATEVLERIQEPLPEEAWLEGSLRVGEDQPYRPDPELGWSGDPGSTLTRFVDGTRLQFTHNSQGYLGDEPQDDDRPRVLILGDSFAWGSGVMPEDSLGGRLAAALPDAQVINQACQAYHLDQTLLAFRRDGMPWRPRVVVLAFIATFASYESRCMSVGQPKPWCVERGGELEWYGQPVPVLGPNREDRARYCDQQQFLRVTSPGEALDFLWREWLPRDSGLGQAIQAAWNRRHLPGMDPLAGRLVAELARDVRSGGGELLLAIAPADYVVDTRWPQRLMSPTVDVLRSAGVEVLELSSLSERPLPELYVEGGNRHPNAAGHALLADTLVPRIRALLAAAEPED